MKATWTLRNRRRTIELWKLTIERHPLSTFELAMRREPKTVPLASLIDPSGKTWNYPNAARIGAQISSKNAALELFELIGRQASLIENAAKGSQRHIVRMTRHDGGSRSLGSQFT